MGQTAVLSALLGFAAAVLLIACVRMLSQPDAADPAAVAAVMQQEEMERLVARAMESAEAKRSQSRSVVSVDKKNMDVDLDKLSDALLGKMTDNMENLVKNYIDEVVEKLDNRTFVKQSRSVVLTPEEPKLVEVRYVGGMQAKRCMDVNPHWKGEVRAWNCQGVNSNYQQLELSGKERLEMDDRCVDVAGVAAGGHVKMAACSDAATQKWSYAAAGGAELRPVGALRNEHTGLCLNVKSSGGYPEAVIAEACSGSCGQLWSVSLDLRSSTRVAAAVSTYNEDVRRKEPRVLCWIMTHGANHRTKATAVNNTWGRRCTYLVFVSSSPDDLLNVVHIKLDGPDSRNMLRPKSKLGWLYMYEHFLDDADWFLKGDDDSYVVMENLKV